MVRSCIVIAQRLGGVFSEENRTGILYLGHGFIRILRQNLQMLGCNFIDGINGLLHIFGNEDISVVIHGFPDDLLTG